MSATTDRATEGFDGAEGRFEWAFNAAMRAHSLDASTLTNLLAALQRQAQGLAQLARAVAEMDDKLNAIRKKLGTP